MKKEDFTAVTSELPKANKHIIVTNNINATNAHGEKSHVWLTSFLQHNKEDGYLTFDAADRKIVGITHWKYA
jgi:hypothetical protein